MAGGNDVQQHRNTRRQLQGAKKFEGLVQILLDKMVQFGVTVIHNHNVGPLKAPRGR